VDIFKRVRFCVLRDGEDFPMLGGIPTRYLVRLPLILILEAAVLFLSAGRLDLPRAWFYMGVTAIQTLASVMMIAKFNPALVMERALSVTKQDIKAWDKILMPAGLVMQYVVLLAVIGLDVGRFHWSSLGIHYAIVGLALLVVGAVLGVWAAASNPYFEAVVRIQRDRGHKVVTTGPYSIVRHPGYVGAILSAVSAPLIIGSVVGLVPVGIVVMLLILRTALEGKALHNELDGYADCAHKVKYRLLPWLW
jgi:protein-S-isoprenylcysteine O-methyltransferase Ste14